MRPTVTTSFQIMDLDSILHSSLRDTPQNFHLSNLFFSHPSTVPFSTLSLLLSFSVTKLNVTHGGEDSQIYGIKLQITLSSQEILKDVFQMMRRGIWKQCRMHSAQRGKKEMHNKYAYEVTNIHNFEQWHQIASFRYFTILRNLYSFLDHFKKSLQFFSGIC